MYKLFSDRIQYAELEEEILTFWDENSIFKKTLEERKDNPIFSFYEGPPTANGRPGIHHLMARSIKDLICRYKTMRGFNVPRIAGWDTHGLPVEIAVEKTLGLTNKPMIEKFGVDKFNQACKDYVYNTINQQEYGWNAFTRRSGYWVDMDKAYVTCTNDYVESLWWSLKEFFDKGLIYKGYKVIPQSPTIETPLSSHELSQAYKKVRDPNCYVKIKIENSLKESIIGASIIVWTTTPWTLFANVALAIGESIDYSLVKNIRKDGSEETLVLASSRLSILDGTYEVLEEFSGKDLVGTAYEQIFNDVQFDKTEFPHVLTIFPAAFVTDSDGSGIVHIAPAFGQDDFEFGKLYKLPFPQPVLPNGHFTDEVKEFAGRAVKTFTYVNSTEEGADKDIIISLKKAGKIYKSAMDYEHDYPHCWRTGNPVIYYARESWFIKTPEYREKMVELNKQITWQPPEIGAGRFGNWIAEAKEWSLSRDRYWGTPLPLWVSEDGSDVFAVGSIEMLQKGTYVFDDGIELPVSECGIEVDLHRPFVDNVIFRKNNTIYRRVHEVIDVWYDSGSMPFASMHYPFENKDLFEKTFPGDFIAEGIDQTRGWFYTLHNIGTALFGKPAFKSVIVNELILDKHGVKMSKKLGNVLDPFELMEKYGADSIRWYFMVNNPPWMSTKFNVEDIQNTVLADFFRSITNIYQFYAQYANIDSVDGNETFIPIEDRLEIDRWILSKSNTVMKNYLDFMDSYELTKATRMVQSFVIDDVSNWYVRRNRRRFWKGITDSEKLAAYQTLREVLHSVVTMIAPFTPFLAENLFQRLRVNTDLESIHLVEFNKENLFQDTDLERRMERAQIIVSLARSLREKSKIKIRQPLSKILIPFSNPQERRDIAVVEDIICEELNVKGIEFISDDSGIVKRFAKANFKTLGKKFGGSTQKVANAIKELSNNHLKMLELNGFVTISIEGNEVAEIALEHVDIIHEDIEGWLVANQGIVTVALDTSLTKELINEGTGREIVNRIQSIRKELKFEITDRIEIQYFTTDSQINNSFETMNDYICSETLAVSCTAKENVNNQIVDINGSELQITLIKQ